MCMYSASSPAARKKSRLWACFTTTNKIVYEHHNTWKNNNEQISYVVIVASGFNKRNMMCVRPLAASPDVCLLLLDFPVHHVQVHDHVDHHVQRYLHHCLLALPEVFPLRCPVLDGLLVLWDLRCGRRVRDHAYVVDHGGQFGCRRRLQDLRWSPLAPSQVFHDGPDGFLVLWDLRYGPHVRDDAYVVDHGGHVGCRRRLQDLRWCPLAPCQVFHVVIRLPRL